MDYEGLRARRARRPWMSAKRRRRHSPEQIVKKLRDADAMLNAGKELAAVLQALEVSESTFERWRRQYGGMKSEEAKRLKQLEEENKQLKSLVAELTSGQPHAEAHYGGKLVSPSRKRAAVRELQGSFDVSERRACKVLDQPRSTQRYQSTPRDDEGPLVNRMLELVRARPRFGYRRIGDLLREEAWKASDSRVYRLWRREGLKVPRKKRKRRRLGKSENGCHRHRATAPNEVWAWDFAFDRTTSGSQLKWLGLIDEYTRECLALKVDTSITGEDLIDTLAELFAMRCVPKHIRSDNGPEFAGRQTSEPGCSRLDVESLYIEPGSPWENGYVGELL